MSLMGKEGLREVAEHCVSNAHYLANEISNLEGFELAYSQPFFKEFAIKTPIPAKEIIEKLKKEFEKEKKPDVDGSIKLDGVFVIGTAEGPAKELKL